MVIREVYSQNSTKHFTKECNEIRLRIPAYGEKYLGRYLFPGATVEKDASGSDFNYNEFDFTFHDYYEFIDFCDKMNEMKRELQKEIAKKDQNRVSIKKGW